MSSSILAGVDSPADIRRLSVADLERLAGEIRERIIAVTARNGGHTAPSLGVVELTLALHCVYETPFDTIVWDVGHQCYAHKLVTGRRNRFDSLRQEGGIAGFPKRAESEYDQFDTGHSGDSVSVVLGLAVGRALAPRRGAPGGRCVAVIGDGSVVSGMAFEALNHVGALKQNLTVVLNDNEMSIGRTSGAMAGYLNRVITGQMYNRMRDDAWNLLGLLPRDISDRARHAARKLEEGLKNLVVPSLLFEELGFRYIGPVDGHNLPELLATFRRVRELHGPVLVHAVTRKGRGYKFAVEDPERFHGTGPFDCDSGRALGGGVTSFTSTFGHTLVELAERDNRVAAITAGMCLGTGLAEFRSRYPDRFFDVGIAEQHAVTFGAGLAQAGMRPVVAVYSTFLTRALDQVVQDVALQRLPVVLAVDRAGLVGEDGPTHHGMFDLTYLSMVPGLAIMAPRDEGMLELMLRFGVLYEDGPVAIRYPRGSTAGDSRLPVDGREGRSELRMGKAEVLREGGDGCVAAVGSMVLPAVQAADDLSLAGLRLTVVDVRFVKPLDEELFCRLAERFGRMVTVEEGVLAGGFGSCVQAALQARGFSRTEVLRIGLPDRFVEHGSRASLLHSVGLTAKGLAVRFEQLFRTGGPSRKAEV